jgi:hypothetical protein
MEVSVTILNGIELKTIVVDGQTRYQVELSHGAKVETSTFAELLNILLSLSGDVENERKTEIQVRN